MCEKRLRKIKKGSHTTRLREARRLQRIQRMTPAPASEDHSPTQMPQMIDKAAQNKLIIELAWKTVVLMRKNKVIQQKIIDLQKETSEFVATVMSNPDNRRRYMEQMRFQQINTVALPQDLTMENKENTHIIFKTEPEA